MFRARRAVRWLLVASLCVDSAAAQTRPTLGSILFPETGADFSGIDQFYVIAEILAKDTDPSDSQWNALLATPGYRLVGQQSRNMRTQLAVALKPSLKMVRDSMLGIQNDRAMILQHLIRAAEDRDAILAMKRALEQSIRDSVVVAVRAAARFLPTGTTDGRPAPFIGFAVFGPDGYALDGGVLLDPLYVRDYGIVDLLSHEFHHAFLGDIDKTARQTGQAPEDAAFAASLIALRTEGIADQIDKPHPLPLRGGPLDAYVTRYNEVYGRTPVILKSIDSLLAVVADSPSVARAAGAKARSLLWSNSHPNGAYVARQIVQTFGVDSLLPAIYNPFALLRIFAAAEKKRGNAPPFSTKAIGVLDAMEKRYVRP